MAKYVYSSLPNSQIYSTDVGDIFIAGGANCTNKYMVIDRAVVTPVTDSQATALTKCEAFLRHQKRGFLKIVNSKEEVEKVGSDMNSSDKSNPLTDEELAVDKNKAKATVNKAK